MNFSKYVSIGIGVPCERRPCCIQIISFGIEIKVNGVEVVQRINKSFSTRCIHENTVTFQVLDTRRCIHETILKTVGESLVYEGISN